MKSNRLFRLSNIKNFKMPKKNFLLLSLEDSKVNKIANIVSNASCKKILDYLAENEGTETEIAQKLQIPLSTAHYNLQQLMDSGLISAEEYHYSPKGKEVYHYKLANKYIIIAPKKVYGIKEKLRNILPAGLIAIGAAALLQIFSSFFSKPAGESFMVAKSAEIAQPMAESAQEMAIATKTVYLVPENIALWFLIGALFTIIVYFLWSRIRKEH